MPIYRHLLSAAEYSDIQFPIVFRAQQDHPRMRLIPRNRETCFSARAGETAGSSITFRPPPCAGRKLGLNDRSVAVCHFSANRNRERERLLCGVGDYLVFVVSSGDSHFLHPGLECGSLTTSVRSTQNQAHTAGHLGPSAALSARIEHNSEHNSAWEEKGQSKDDA
jgi:hypothetical protein